MHGEQRLFAVHSFSWVRALRKNRLVAKPLWARCQTFTLLFLLIFSVLWPIKEGPFHNFVKLEDLSLDKATSDKVPACICCFLSSFSLKKSAYPGTTLQSMFPEPQHSQRKGLYHGDTIQPVPVIKSRAHQGRPQSAAQVSGMENAEPSSSQESPSTLSQSPGSVTRRQNSQSYTQG